MSDNVRNRLLVEITKAGEELRLDNGPAKSRAGKRRQPPLKWDGG